MTALATHRLLPQSFTNVLTRFVHLIVWELGAGSADFDVDNLHGLRFNVDVVVVLEADISDTSSLRML